MRKSSARVSSRVGKSTITSLLDKKNGSGQNEKYNFDHSHVPPKIDNKRPASTIKAYYKPHRLEADAQTIMKIDAENFELIKKLNAIHRTTGLTDCWNRELKYLNNLSEKQENLNKVMEKDEEIITRMSKSSGTADSMHQRKKSKLEKEKSKKRLSKHRKSSRISKKKPLTKSIKDHTRPICYFEIEIAANRRKLGKLIFQLFVDIVPKTCENFVSFCRGFNGLSYQYVKKVGKTRPEFDSLLYSPLTSPRGTPFHRIVPGYWCQGGDVQKFNGSGEISIYGETFEDENFELKHSERGILSTCGFEKDSNCSKFNLTFKQLVSVDGKRVVFGKVIDGLATLEEIERFGSVAGKPTMKIIVSSCGIMEYNELES